MALIVAQHRDKANNLSGILLTALDEGLKKIYAAAKRHKGRDTKTQNTNTKKPTKTQITQKHKYYSNRGDDRRTGHIVKLARQDVALKASIFVNRQIHIKIIHTAEEGVARPGAKLSVLSNSSFLMIKVQAF